MLIAHDDRIAALRRRVLDRKNDREVNLLRRNSVVTARSLRTTEGISSWQLRRGLLTRDRLAAIRFDVDDLELLAGRLALGRTNGSEAERKAAEDYLAQYPPHVGQTGHCELDVSPVTTHGIDAFSRDIAKLGDNANGRAENYASFLYALDGLSRMIENAVCAVVAAMPDASPDRRAELLKMADSCRRIAHEPPQTFRDAIQLLWFAIFGVMHGEMDVHLVVPGHLDRTLAPFYARDRANGTLSREDALLLIQCLYLLISEYVPDGLAMSVMVGGRDREGKDVTNDLSYLCLEALRGTRMIYPTVGICWHEGTPRELVELGIDLIGHGICTAAFFGDETIQRGLKGLGVPIDDACHYINSTCVEITPARGSNVWVASPYFNMCQILLDTIADATTNAQASSTFDDFLDSYFAHAAERIAQAVEEHNQARRDRREFGGKPLQSVFTRDCVARGRDIDDGGARYNWIECSFVGLANLVDSLHVIREEVFTQRTLSLAELKVMLDADFRDAEPTRLRFLRGYPKYGQDCPEVDGLFARIVAFLVSECAGHKCEPDGSPFVPGAFCWVMHAVLGQQCGATPDGRKARFPFADGCGPAQGREVRGPTAAIRSTTSWDHSPMLGGLAYNMKFNRSFFDSRKGYETLRDLILTFLRRGGFETQVNVVDAETLKRAREHPEAYRDLMVRIGGYADYFTRLSPEMQEEVIMRTEFASA